MLEPLRSRYLAALGVDMYVPRVTLPGAKISAVCEWEEMALSAEPEQPLRVSALLESMQPAPAVVVARAATADLERKPEPVKPVAAAPRAESVVPKFALSIVLAANGVLLIDDAPSSNAARSEFERLLAGFLNAVNKDAQFALDVFLWPLRKSPSIAQDETAARETLTAHLHKQIEQRALHTVLLLGEAAQRWVNLDETNLRCIRSNSLLGCLRDPSLKRQLWHDVRGLSVR
ncbi:MAG: hypothetical protein JWM78_1961 [Verrucomicrobiaceae bacterium]|nr:hypothetical protein [Verrucomicrobiaceae bacterium]